MTPEQFEHLKETAIIDALHRRVLNEIALAHLACTHLKDFTETSRAYPKPSISLDRFGKEIAVIIRHLDEATDAWNKYLDHAKMD